MAVNQDGYGLPIDLKPLLSEVYAEADDLGLPCSQHQPKHAKALQPDRGQRRPALMNCQP